MFGIINLSFVYNSGFIFFRTQAENIFINPGKVQFDGLVQFLIYIRDNDKLGLKYYANIEDVPISNLFRQSRIRTGDQLMVLSD